MKITWNPEKNALNIITGGIAFGIWQHSIWACIAFLGLLAVISNRE